MFVCFRIFVFGLEYALLWFLNEFRSFWLLIHFISSPIDVATLFFVLICWVDFIVIFRDDFSTIFQSCVVFFVMRERVTVCNPKTDLKLEFGCPRYGWRTEGARERSGWPWSHLAHAMREAVGPTARDPLWSCEAHAPPKGWVTWPLRIGPENLLSPCKVDN